MYKLLECLGFKYKVKQKTYYTDQHENVEVRKHRGEFCRTYLDKEIRMYRWVQLTMEEYSQYSKEIGCYDHMDGNTVEIHVDKCPEKLLLTKVTTPYGGNKSVRMPANVLPLIQLGQDEAIIKQNILPNRQWVGPNGERPLTPKDDGIGIMYSCFISREFGLFQHLTQAELDKINTKRRGSKYKDSHAIKRLRGTDDKKDLKSSPFVRTLDYGVNAEGYWGYDNIAEQFEDCVDALKTLYGDEFDFDFMFDQSSGHCKKQDGGLNVVGMNKEFGGRQKKLRDTYIADEQGYLGTEHEPRLLNKGDWQHFTFDTRDVGPFYLSEQERDDRKNDQETTEMRPRKRLKTDLENDLKAKDVSCHRMKMTDLQTLCARHDIPIEVTETIKIEGWMGREKGLLQACYERGLIDPNKIYKVDDLKAMLQECTDFKNEITQLQQKASECGVNVTYSTKCHPEKAGEGIEFLWALIKNEYRRIPYPQKPKIKEAFHKKVEELVFKTTVDSVRKCSRKARKYICAYNELHQGNYGQKAVPMADIERLQKAYKQHRGVSYKDVSILEAEINFTPNG